MRTEAEIRAELARLENLRRSPRHLSSHQQLGVERCELDGDVLVLRWVLEEVR